MRRRASKSKKGDLAGLALIALSIILSMGLLPAAQANQSNASLAVLNTVCNVFNTVKSVIFILGLTLMLLGAAIYSGANLMPSQTRGSFQGYGMSMIVGGVVGTAIAVAAPYILNTVINASGSNTAALLANTSGNYDSLTGQYFTGGGSVVGGVVTGECSEAAQAAANLNSGYGGNGAGSSW